MAVAPGRFRTLTNLVLSTTSIPPEAGEAACALAMSNPETFVTVHSAPDVRPSTLHNSRSFQFASRNVDQTFLIDVALPLMPVPEGEKLPVIYVLDGNIGFALAAQTARLLQMGPYPLPQAIVVGIGYHAATVEEANRIPALRFRDMTPWTDEVHEARFRNAPPPWTLPDDIRQGGADAFGAFIEEELKPFIEATFPADPQDATIVGMSLGGLFVLHSLLAAPLRFQRYIAASPSLYWAERRIFDLEASYGDAASDLPASLFLSVGALEEAHDLDCRMVSNGYEMEARLRNRAWPGLDLTFEVFPGETHMSVFPAALSRGLTTVFGGHGDIHNWSRRLSA